MSENSDLPDAYILETVADWQVARLKAMLSWAESDKKTLFDLRDECTEAPTAALKSMSNCQQVLAVQRPQTIEGACALLLVVRTILAHQMLDPEREGVMSQGPLLEIVFAVHDALKHGPSETILRKSA
jgi:hypothetical protein